jgi:hypothetical protein
MISGMGWLDVVVWCIKHIVECIRRGGHMAGELPNLVETCQCRVGFGKVGQDLSLRPSTRLDQCHHVVDDRWVSVYEIVPRLVHGHFHAHIASTTCQPYPSRPLVEDVSSTSQHPPSPLAINDGYHTLTAPCTADLSPWRTISFLF